MSIESKLFYTFFDVINKILLWYDILQYFMFKHSIFVNVRLLALLLWMVAFLLLMNLRQV